MTRKWEIPSLLQRCLVALLIVAAASGFRALFFGGLGRGIPYLLYFPAVTLASLYGGLPAGLVATMFSAALTYFWVQRVDLSPVELLALAIFVGSGALIAGVCEALRCSHRRTTQALEKTEATNQQLLGRIAERKQAEAALRDSNEYLDNLLNYANAPIIVWNAEGKITRFNHAFEEIAGRKAAAVLGHGLDLLFAEDQREQAMGIVRRAGAGERFELVEVPIYHPSGSQRTVLWNSAPVFGADQGRQIATIAQGQDITVRKAAEVALRETNEYLDNLFNYANAPIIVWDPQLHITRFNHAFEALTGRTAEEVIGKSLELLFPPAWGESSMALIKKTTGGERWETVEISILHHDGAIRTVLWNSATVYAADGKTPVATIAQGQDITESKRAEEKIRTLNTELEQRVRDRTTALEAANQELEAFAYSVSHDLRAPLRSIDGFSRIIQEDYAARLDEEGRDSLQRIRAATQRMAHLIDDLLELARVSRAGLRHERVDLSALARDVVAELQRSEPGRKVALVVPDGVVADGDPALLRVVLENLLGNAWKFTGRCARAQIEFGAVHPGGQTVYSVRDNGAGFDPAYAGKLFGAFQRLHNSTDFPGTGIGLVTVQRIVHRHGGRVWAEGEVNKGATFHFNLGAAA